MSGIFGSGRLRVLTGALLAAVFLFLGFKLLQEDRAQLGALLLAFALFRGGLAAAQYNEERSASKLPPG